MKCPFCGFLDSKVIDSRPAENDSSIRRRRECLECRKHFTTCETMEKIPLVVIKKDGSRQAFDKSKMLASMVRSCEKRSVSLDVLSQLANEIEQYLQNEMIREIPTAKNGELVMEKLKSVDEVAYVRFASIYSQFADIDAFLTEECLRQKMY